MHQPSESVSRGSTGHISSGSAHARNADKPGHGARASKGGPESAFTPVFKGQNRIVVIAGIT